MYNEIKGKWKYSIKKKRRGTKKIKLRLSSRKNILKIRIQQKILLKKKYIYELSYHQTYTYASLLLFSNSLKP